MSLLKRDELDEMSKSELVDLVFKFKKELEQKSGENIISKPKKVKKPKKKKHKFSKKIDWNKYKQRQIALKMCYLGWEYQGFVVQKDTMNTIEEHFFQACERINLIKSRKEANYSRCGRTDKGVSAYSQVVSIRVRSNGLAMQEMDYVRKINQNLPKEIRILAWSPVDDKFNARFDCLYRTYIYYFKLENGMNLELMKQGASKLIGTHDFRNFCKLHPDVNHYIRSINYVRIHPVKDQVQNNMYYLEINGRGFLWHMVRCVVYILFQIGKGNESVNIVENLLDVQTNPSRPQYKIASEIPLILYDCGYDPRHGIKWNTSCDPNIGQKTMFHSVDKHFMDYFKEILIKTCMIKTVWNGIQEIPFPSNNEEMEGEEENEMVEWGKIRPQYETKHQEIQRKKYIPIFKLQRCATVDQNRKKRKKK